MENKIETIQLDKNLLAPEDLENTKLITNDDGSVSEVYISRAGNIVTDPRDRAKDIDVSRQQRCWDLYVKSLATKPSATQAALDAGYCKNTATNIRKMRWFKDKLRTLRQSKAMSYAERNVFKALKVEWSKMKVNEKGEEVEEIDKDLMKEVLANSWRLLETVGKDKGYNKKTEIEGNMGGEIKITSVSYADAVDQVEAKVIDTVEQVVLDEIKDDEN